MKTLMNSHDRNEILRRLVGVSPTSRPRWGAMSSDQMICHLSDSFRASLGEKNISSSTSLFKRTLFKWVALWVPISWPRGIKTRPEMDQKLGGTSPVAFASDMAFCLSAFITQRASSPPIRCSDKCPGLSGCAMPISTWIII
jgi:hypothetical protein